MVGWLKRLVMRLVRKVTLALLNDPEFSQKFAHVIWKGSNYTTPLQNWGAFPYQISDMCFWMAATDTASYVTEHMLTIHRSHTSIELLEFSTSQSSRDGLFLEFGVWSGFTINALAKQVPELTIHGFDSFQGLPENWSYAPAGFYSTGGSLPVVRENVRLHVGWFDQTLPEFVKNNPQKVSFVHVDSDLYSSLKTILNGLAPQITVGTIIQFDEYFNYPGWRDHEYKAFQEFVRDFGVQYEYVGYNDCGYSVAVRILGKAN